MVEIGIELRRHALQEFQPRPRIQLGRHGELDRPHAEQGVGVIADDSKAGALCELKRDRVGVCDDQHAAAHRLALIVGFEQGAIFPDQLLQPKPAKVEQGWSAQRSIRSAVCRNQSPMRALQPCSTFAGFGCRS
jgi:hypothetical protein